MELEEICRPVAEDLKLVDEEYGKNATVLAKRGSKEIIEYYLKNKGKYLRPLLVLLSARAVSAGNLPDNKVNRIRLAVACELIHSASLIHDDIVDGSETRRGQATLFTKFGSKLAVLIGDLLYSQAFILLTRTGRMDLIGIVCNTSERMCNGEIKEMRVHRYSEQQDYLEVIEGKTAVFMSTCCKCGAMLSTKDEKLIASLANFGMNAGMTYQLVDDYLDNDCNVAGVNSLRASEDYANKAKEALEVIPPSIYKEKLLDLIDYMMHCTKVGNAG